MNASSKSDNKLLMVEMARRRQMEGHIIECQEHVNIISQCDEKDKALFDYLTILGSSLSFIQRIITI